MQFFSRPQNSHTFIERDGILHHFSLIPNFDHLPKFLHFSDAYPTEEGADCCIRRGESWEGRKEAGILGRRKDK